MAALANVSFSGKSGKKYAFEVHSNDTTFNDVGAVYFITRRHKDANNNFVHTRIYIGQTDNLKTRFTNHHRLNCFNRHNWNCICVHRDDNESSRLNKEKDLIANYNPPCNQE